MQNIFQKIILATCLLGILSEAQSTSTDSSFQVSQERTFCDRTPMVQEAILEKINSRWKHLIWERKVDCSNVGTRDLEFITNLDLSEKSISTLQPDDLSGLSGLKELNLSNNDLSILPSNVLSGLSGLKELNLSNNDLSILPSNVFSDLDRIRLIDLSNNQLEGFLPTDIFAGLIYLERLDLNDNKLTSLQPGLLIGLKRLQWISLFNNYLSDLPEETFFGLRALRHIDLRNNWLPYLRSGLFHGLNSLALLDLSKNYLKELPDEIFVAGPSAPLHLILIDNIFSNLPVKSFTGLHEESIINLINNPISWWDKFKITYSYPNSTFEPYSLH